MCTNSDGDKMSLLNSDGDCSTCGKSAMSSYVACFMCHEKFHAVGCSVTTNICNQSFLNLFKPLNEKSRANSQRPGNFLFTCEPCLTEYERKHAVMESDKLVNLQKQVNKLDQGLEDIKQLLVKKTSTSPTINEKSCWEKCPTVPSSNVDAHDVDSTLNSEKQKKSVLVIENTNDDVNDNHILTEVENIVVHSNIAIKNSYKNKNGNTVVICNSDDQRQFLHDEIKKSLPDVVLKQPTNMPLKTIAVVGFNPSYNETILDSLLKQNKFVSDFLSLNVTNPSENHIKLVKVMSLKNNPNRSQAIFQVSPALRSLLNRHNDKLLVGMLSVVIYDRINVIRCYGCQRFGHIQTKCPTPTVVHCAKCGGNHDTRSCTENPNKMCCVNCTANGSPNHNHAASSTSCPAFKEQYEKLKHLN